MRYKITIINLRLQLRPFDYISKIGLIIGKHRLFNRYGSFRIKNRWFARPVVPFTINFEKIPSCYSALLSPVYEDFRSFSKAVCSLS